MSLQNRVVNHPAHNMNGKVLEKVLLGNDLSSLNSIEKVQYINNICTTLGLNPLTRPIQLIKFQGKEIPYFTKDSTEQLRKNNNISITKIDTKILDGGIYVATAYASSPDGRTDSSTGVISISGLKGDALANAMMKAETKSKRRVTLSICGLGFLDESEVESMPGARKLEAVEVREIKIESIEEKEDSILDLELTYVSLLEDIKKSESIDRLQEVFKEVKKYNFRNKRPDLLDKLIDEKDARKTTLTSELSNEYFDDEVSNEAIV